MNNPLSGTDPSGYVAEDEKKTITKEVTVVSQRPGSRIKTRNKVTVTGTSDGKGGMSVTVSGSNGAVVGQVAGQVAGKMAGSGLNVSVSDIGSPSQTAKNTPTVGSGNNGLNLNQEDYLKATNQGSGGGSADVLTLGGLGALAAAGEKAAEAASATVGVLGRALGALSVLTIPNSSGTTPDILSKSTVLSESDTDALTQIRESGNYVNLDTSTLRALVSNDAGLIAEITAAVGSRKLLVTQMAAAEFAGSLKSLGQDSSMVIKAVALMSLATVVPNMPSERVMSMSPTRTVKLPDQLIFGTGDRLGAQTFSADGRFVRAAANQGVILNTYLHKPHSMF